MSVQNVKAASCCQMFGWVLRMLLSTRAIGEYCLARWRQMPFKRHWMFLLSLKVKKPLIWTAVFLFFVSFFFSLWLARAWEEFHGLVNSSGRWSNAPPPSVTPRVGPHLSSYVTSWHTSQLPALLLWAGMFSCLMGLVVGPFCYWLFPKGQNDFLIFFFLTKDTNIRCGIHSRSIFCCDAVCYFANMSFLCARHLYPRPGPRRLRGMSSAWICCLGLTVSRYGVVNEC